MLNKPSGGDCLRRFGCTVVLCLAPLAGALAQCPVVDPNANLPPPAPLVTSSTRTGEPQLPESGYLTNTAYASTYFGFVIDLPIPLDGHRLMLPLMPPGQHALPAIGFQEGRRSGTLLITASEPPNPVHEMTEQERRAEFEAWSKGNPSHQITPPDWMTRTGRWYHIIKHDHEVTTIQYWTFIRNYLIRVKVTSNDAAFVRDAKQAVAAVKFYCPQEDGTLINEQGQLIPTPGEGYHGPTIPAAVVDAALKEKPGLEFLERGTFDNATYRNESAGVTVQLPAGWNHTPADARPAAETEAAHRTRELLDACTLGLFRLVNPKSPGTISLVAIDQTCLGLPAPMSGSDTLGAEALGAYLHMLGMLGEVRSSRLAQPGDQLFAEYQCFSGQANEDHSLAHRLVQAAAVTRHRKLLLLWTWDAESPQELAALPGIQVGFEDRPKFELSPASLAKP